MFLFKAELGQDVGQPRLQEADLLVTVLARATCVLSNRVM